MVQKIRRHVLAVGMDSCPAEQAAQTKPDQGEHLQNWTELPSVVADDKNSSTPLPYPGGMAGSVSRIDVQAVKPQAKAEKTLCHTFSTNV